MKGKKVKRLTAAVVALAMIGLSLPADIGGFGLFGGSTMTASAADVEYANTGETVNFSFEPEPDHSVSKVTYTYIIGFDNGGLHTLILLK